MRENSTQTSIFRRENLIARFPLMPEGQYVNGIVGRVMPIQSDIAARRGA